MSNCNSCDLTSKDNTTDVLIMQLKREVKELANSTNATLLLQNGKIAETCTYIKNNLSNYLRTMIDSMEQSGELANIITTTVLSEINIGKAMATSPSSYGAVGDGTTLDTAAVNSAFATNHNAPSKIVFVPTSYALKGTISLYSNTIVDFNYSTIIDAETTYNDTTRDSAGLRFINAACNMPNGIENIILKNGIFDGRTCGILFAIFKGKNILVENCIFKNCCMGTHIFDLCGCENVVFDHCIFTGCSLPAALNYREMIQLDYAAYSSFPYLGNTYVFDNAGCDNITIKNCTFDKGELATYPNAIGTHGSLAERHTNVFIMNNIFHDTTIACIRFPRVKNIHIEKNTFYNEGTSTSGRAAILFENGRYQTDTVTSEDIFIQNNEFIPTVSVSNLLFLHIYSDTTLGYFHKNIIISGNTIKGTFTSLVDGTDALQIGNISDVIIENNIFSNIKNTILYRNNFDAKNIMVQNNRFIKCRQVERKYDTNELSNISFKNNTFENESGVVTIYEDEKREQLFNNIVTTGGTITTSKNLNEFEYLIISSGGMDDQTYMNAIVMPFDINVGFRVSQDYYTFPTASGIAKLQITGENTISVINTANNIRKVFGIREF